MDSIKETETLVEAMNIANNIQPYKEGVADVVQSGVRAVKNFFGTKAGAAARNQKAAQQNLQAAQVQAQANNTNAQADTQSNVVDDITLATQLNKFVNYAIKKANSNLEDINNSNAQARADRGEVKAATKNTEQNNEQQSEQQQGEQTNGQ